MNKRTPISKIMSTDIISVNSNNTVADVVDIFKSHSIRHIPVVSGSEIIGLISKTDIERISFVNGIQENSASTQVYDILDIKHVMTTDLDCVQCEQPIKEAAEIFSRGKFHALPVLEGKELKGIVTTTDIINYLLEQY